MITPPHCCFLVDSFDDDKFGVISYKTKAKDQFFSGFNGFEVQE